MWTCYFFISISCLLWAAIIPLVLNKSRFSNKRSIGLLSSLLAGSVVASFFMFLPIHMTAVGSGELGGLRAMLLSLFNTIQVMSGKCGYSIVSDSIVYCPDWLGVWYQVWALTLFVIVPFFTLGVVLSFFKNLTAYLKFYLYYFRDVYVFSELNDRSVVLAKSIKAKNKKAVIIFTDAFKNGEKAPELIEAAEKMRALCFKKDILAVNFGNHSVRKPVSLFTIGVDEMNNLNQSLMLIDKYKDRNNTHLYVFSTKIESELLLTQLDKGNVKVRRINKVQALVNRILYEQGNILFETAKESADGSKKISAIVVGMGNHGTEMVKALSWFGQMDGYKLEINAFDKDKLADDKFVALAPELMSPVYNGVQIEGEAQYKITIHPGRDVAAYSFVKDILSINDATYVFVALGDDDTNINTAVNLRMYFERMKIHPVIQTVIYNPHQKKALAGICNYRGQEYDIEFVGDAESSYTADVIIDSELEEDALKRHLKWGKEEEFWTYEYNYRSSIASAIHMKARIACNIPGANKREEDLTEEERKGIETLEHRRWNAYMRAEGYVYSGCNDTTSRNDLAKMHPDLVDYASLSEEEKRKDSRVGTI